MGVSDKKFLLKLFPEINQCINLIQQLIGIQIENKREKLQFPHLLGIFNHPFDFVTQRKIERLYA